MKNQNNPLVSVFILTYNSQDYIIEALESVKSQTYQDIELIVSDDGSKDGTPLMVKEWISLYKDRFVRAELVEVSKNTGTSANYNRAVRACHGEWLKMLDGDDKLLPEGIALYVDYIKNHPSSSIVVGKVKGFGNEKASKDCVWLDTDRHFQSLDRKQRARLLLEYNYVPSASVLINRRLYDDLGGFDENISLIEDWPFWLKAVSRGFDFDYLPSYTAAYRFSSSSVSQPENQHSPRYVEDYKKSVNLARHYMCEYGITGKWYSLSKMKLVKNNTLLTDVFSKLNIFNPFWWKQKMILRKVSGHF